MTPQHPTLLRHLTDTSRVVRYTTAAIASVALALSFSACSSQSAEAPATPTPGTSAPTETTEDQASPQRIAALDYESAEALAALGLADRVVLVPEAVLNPVLGGHTDELADVEATFPVAMEVEAETVIALTPDLVIMSPRHGNETPIAEVLNQAGIETLLLPSSWVSPEALATNLELIGEATGVETEADALVDELQSGLAAAAAGSSATDENAPRVLMLTNQAGRPFVSAGNAYPIELLSLAGAHNVATDLGIDRTGPITAEQIVQANPDGIVLIDMNGTGDRMFAELLSNAAVAAEPAVAEGRMLRIEGRSVQALGLTSTIDGLETLSGWVDSLR